MSPEQQLSQLTAGTAKVLSEKELLEKLNLGRPLRIKLGVDPTEVHERIVVALLGHSTVEQHDDVIRHAHR